jgi:hypothetical protein
MRGLKQDRSARVVIAGHGFVQNIRRGHYELASRSQRSRDWRSRSTSSPWPSDPEFSRRDFSMQWTGQMQQRPTEDSTSMPRGRLPPERSMPLLDGEKWQTYANKRENPSTGLTSSRHSWWRPARVRCGCAGPLAGGEHCTEHCTDFAPATA